MSEPDPESEPSPHAEQDAHPEEPHESGEPEDAEKRLEDLDPEDEEALGVQGGQRTFGRYGKRL